MLPRHLSKAPITEALLDIRVDGTDDISVDILRSMQDHMAGRYPTVRPRKKFEANFNVDGQSIRSNSNVEEVGFVFWSEDEKRAVQARLDGFSFSWLKPYPDWATFRDEAKALWGTYRSIAKPTHVRRMALRYINRFPLPRPLDLGEHLNTYPQLGHTSLGDPDGFLMRLASTQPDGTQVVLSEAIDESGTTPGEVPVILDIDVSKRFEPGISEFEECWGTFESLRDLKNKVFFDSIKDSIAKVFL